VPVHVTVTDKAGRLVTDLLKEDFEVRDNGKPQPVTLFDNTPQAIRLIVLIDVSGSMVGNLSLLRSASNELFNRLRPDDLVRVGSFGHEVTISPTFTNEPSEMRAALPTEIRPDAPTPLWSAVDRAMTSFDSPGEGAAGRRVVLVLSDGKDSGPLGFGKFVTQPEVSDRAQEEGFMIYAIGLASRTGAGMGSRGAGGLGAQLLADLPDPGLSLLARDTGGGYFELRPRDDLGAAFARVADELHRQYLLGFAPVELDGKLHKLEVKLKKDDLTPRARKTYLAPKKPS
jgi:Ca-activated chloride channel family protein